MPQEAIRLLGYPKYYDWGHPDALYRLLNWQKQSRPLAEVWFGTHPAGPTTTTNGKSLSEWLASVGNNSELPYLLKYIAPAKPLSIQVHPDRNTAQCGFEIEESHGIPLEDPSRLFKDPNDKPEMLLALSDMKLLVGIASHVKLREFFTTIGGALCRQVGNLMEAGHVETLFRALIHCAEGFSGEDISNFVDRCRNFTTHASLAIRERALLVTQIANDFPRDPGIIMAAVMNVIHLPAGNVLFVDVGDIHAYLSGVGIELMSASDNVFRAGLTSKHIDIDRFLECARHTPSRESFLEPQVNDSWGLRTSSYLPQRCGLHLEVHEAEPGKFPLVPRKNAIFTCLKGEFQVGGLSIRRGGTLFLTEVREAKCLSSGLLVAASDGSSLEN